MAVGRALRPWLAAYCGPTWPYIKALLAGWDDYLQLLRDFLQSVERM